MSATFFQVGFQPRDLRGSLSVTYYGVVPPSFWPPRSLSPPVKCLPCPKDGKYMMSWPFTQTRFQFSSVAQLCPTLCDPMNLSTPGLSIAAMTIKVTQETKPGYLLCLWCYFHFRGQLGAHLSPVSGNANWRLNLSVQPEAHLFFIPRNVNRRPVVNA